MGTNTKARRTIAMLSQDFIFDGCTILVHCFSRVVLEVLKAAAGNGKIFRVFCTEGRPNKTGLRFAKEMVTLGVPVKLLIDSAVAYTMDEVDMVLFGADGVVESGGIINMMATYQTALVANSMNKPVYVAAESYKGAVGIGRLRKLLQGRAGGKRSFDELEAELLQGQKLQGVSTAYEVYQVLNHRGWQELFPLFSTVHEICSGLVPPTAIVE